MRSFHIGLVFLLIVVAYCQQPKLIMINQLFRHGARYPVYPRQDDGSAKYTYAEHSFGQLTTNGKKMHYVLGQQLYKQYWSKLFSGTTYENRYNQSKFYIKSTDVNRTIESVQSQMMGILQKLDPLYIFQNMTQYSKPQWVPENSADLINVTEGNVFPDAKSYHPIAIHVQKVGTNPYSSGDFLRTYSQENCPNQKLWMDQNRENPRIKQIMSNENFTLAIQNLSATIGRNVTFWEAANYYDNYECAKYMGRNFIKTFENETYARALNYVHTLDMYINLYTNPKQISATSTGFFNETVHNIKKIISNKEATQWNIYSAHDTTVGNMLAALNLTNVECIYQAYLNNRDKNSDTCVSTYPLYTSNLIFEVWQYNSSYNSIKIRYNGEIKKIPFCGWQTECSVQVFYAWFDQWKDVDYIETCGVYDKDIQTYFSIAAAEFMIILVLALMGLIKCLKNKQHESSVAKNSAPSGFSSNSALKDSLLTEQVKSQSLKEN